MALGGRDIIQSITARFLIKAMADDLLGAMFSGKIDHAAHIASYFEANFGGADDYYHDRGDLRFLLAQHADIRITENQRRRWIDLMLLSATEVGIPDYAYSAFSRYLDVPSRNTMTFSNLPKQEALRQLGYLDRPKPYCAGTLAQVPQKHSAAKLRSKKEITDE